MNFFYQFDPLTHGEWEGYAEHVEKVAGDTAALARFRQWYAPIREWAQDKLLNSDNAFEQRAGKRFLAWRRGAYLCQCGQLGSPRAYCVCSETDHLIVEMACGCEKSWVVGDRLA